MPITNFETTNELHQRFGSDITSNKQQKVGADFGATMWLECKDYDVRKSKPSGRRKR